MFQKLKQHIEELDVNTIAEDRKALLDELTAYISFKKKENQPINLNFICTHNSRRSHLGQIWAAAMASYFEISDVLTFSGGTETTAVFPMIIKTLQSQGFRIDIVDESENPLYEAAYGEDDAVYLFSKIYDDESNPDENFAAIMTCSQADEGCPFIAGTDKRIALTYEDPKVSDGTEQQEATYLERSTQIATEMKYVFSNI
ncbi:arsenate reductase [Nonlabens sp. Hel1_33_55]|uniref:protein-tyrosine-phosphatase n=1 Tax=Nonlabens sp. Hel1_33_55 TaxID=1336802 RepID=UPI000875BCCB|nr:protein-tyrosine-phosphatase [Nonlabens sp. Hel1_33_55]SCY33754.1 arsenate reductase [Nonlabens sp. Hel1_33_55]